MTKIVIIGDAAVGKSLLVRRLLGGAYQKQWKYVPTMGVEVHVYKRGERTFELWDCAGVEKFGGLRDGYYVAADAAIVVAETAAEALQWVTAFKRVRPNAPIFEVGKATCTLPKMQFARAADELFSRIVAAMTLPVPRQVSAAAADFNVLLAEMQAKLTNLAEVGKPELASLLRQSNELMEKFQQARQASLETFARNEKLIHLVQVRLTDWFVKLVEIDHAVQRKTVKK